jgi:glyoxylase I family protein
MRVRMIDLFDSDPGASLGDFSLFDASKGRRMASPAQFIDGFHGVRYQTKDVERALTFYRDQLGFRVDHQQLPAFATVSLGDLHILLSGPGASGSRPMPSGEVQQPGGWNRVVLRVTDLVTMIEACTEAGLRFRNEMESGPGGKQIQLLDPDGNPIELFEPGGKK